jgi:hypothetical protein
VTGFAINPGVDHRDTIGKVAPGLFAQAGWSCERHADELPWARRISLTSAR